MLGYLYSHCPLWIFRLLPFLRWLPDVDGKSAKADLQAAIIGTIVVLPQGVAFATIAGMPPAYGLYAAMVPAIVAALFGSSRHLVSGPTTAASVVLFASLSTLAEPASGNYVQLAITLTFMVGVLQLVMGIARLGTLVNLISHTVIIGFTSGAAILIAAKQLPVFLGLHLESGLHVYEIFIASITHADEINLYAVTVGFAALAVSLLVKRRLPQIPYMIAAMTTGILVALLLTGLLGQEHTGIELLGSLSAGLPPISAPDFSLSEFRDLAPVAVAVTILALTEAVSIARTLGSRGGYRVDANQEFVGQGLSNLAGSFFSAYVATGSFNRSAVNYSAGAKTPLAAAIAGVLLLLVVPVIAPVIAFLPKTAMAAILFLVAASLIDIGQIRQVFRAGSMEIAIGLVTFFGTLLLELEVAILMGVLLSLVAYLHKTSRPRTQLLVPDPDSPKRAFSAKSKGPTCPQFRVVQIDGSLYFGAVDHVQRVFEQMDTTYPRQIHQMVICKGINFVDLAGAELLAHEAHRRKRKGGDLYLYEVNDVVKSRLQKCGYLDEIGTNNLFESKTAALNHIVLEKLDKSICANCEQVVFSECTKVNAGSRRVERFLAEHI